MVTTLQDYFLYGFYSTGKARPLANCAHTVHNKHWTEYVGFTNPPATVGRFESQDRFRAGRVIVTTLASNAHGSSVTTDRRCDNPDCTTRVEWTGRAGRPQLYCTPSCRQRALSAAARLQAKAERLESELEDSHLTHRARRALSADLAKTRWLLSAFPESTRVRAHGSG